LPGEPLDQAVSRRLSYELGLTADSVELLLPTFAYRAVMDDGTVENEICPVYRALVSTDPRPNPEEVGGVRWMPWKEFTDDVLIGLLSISPWCGQQVPLLTVLGPDPSNWTAADPAALPPAARCLR
jgi:isopentenyl-diphosphate delta-isomerase